MATWGTHPFENDDAAAFVSEVVQDGPAALSEAFEVALDESGYLEAPEGARAVAAAEVLAAHLSGDASDLPDPELRAWLADLEPGDLADLAPMALSALERVMAEDSEWHEVWAESEDYAGWQAELDRLRTALEE